jgi:ubiquitin C-terminal hydrolase
MINNMPNNMPNNMINNMPNNMPNNMINNMPNNMPNAIPNNMVNNMINNMPNNMVNNMSMPNNIGNNMINCNNIMIIMMNQNMFMNNMMQMYNMFPNVEVPKTVDIKDGFQHYKKDNQLGGQNKLYCQKCGNTCDHIQSNHFYTLPEYLVINLNRGEGNKYQVGATFDEFLDLTNEVQTNLDCNKYRLIGVITHLGPHGTGGHYIAYGFLEEKNMWYKFDDSRVTESTFDEAKTSKPFDNYRCDPYILFYHRLKN